MNIKQIRLDELLIEESPTVRIKTDEETVASYAENYRNKKPMPPIVVFYTKDIKGFYLADGMHRTLAAHQAGMRDIMAEIHDGDWQAALRWALAANASHGLPRSSADKRLCAFSAIKQWPEISNAQIASICEIGDRIVAEVRTEMEKNNEIETTTERKGADGKTRPAKRGEPKPKGPVTDKLGNIIPEEVQKYWIRQDEPKVMIDNITEIMKRIKKAMDDKDIMFAEVNFTGVLADLEKARRTIGTSIPYAVCAQCQGHPETQRGGCRLCIGRGLISEFRWKTVPEEIRNMKKS